MSSTIEARLEWVETVENLRLPPKADQRLQELMDRNNEGLLTDAERRIWNPWLNSANGYRCCAQSASHAGPGLWRLCPSVFPVAQRYSQLDTSRTTHLWYIHSCQTSVEHCGWSPFEKH